MLIKTLPVLFVVLNLFGFFFRFTSESGYQKKLQIEFGPYFRGDFRTSVELRGQSHMWSCYNCLFVSQFFLLLLSCFN